MFLRMFDLYTGLNHSSCCDETLISRFSLANFPNQKHIFYLFIKIMFIL